MRRSPLIWISLASLALAVSLYGCETPEAFHVSGDGSLLASDTGGATVFPGTGGGSGGIAASGGAVGTGGFSLATGGTTIASTGGAAGHASTGGTAGSGHAGSGSGGTAGHGTGGVATGGMNAGGSVGTGGHGGTVGTGGTGTGGVGTGGRGGAAGSMGMGGSAGGSIGTGPCAGLCAPATSFNFSSNTSYSSPNLGTAAACYQVTTTLTIQGGGCSNCTVSSPARTVKINGASASNNGNWTNLPAKVNGGYCIQITAGSPDYTTFYTF